MTTVTTRLDSPPRPLTAGTDLGDRIEGLDQAAAAARGRLDDALLDDVEQRLDRAAGRLRLSAEHTVVAIAGATGSGKSSTFNALTGLELSSTGVRRPTTSWATACVWGSTGADEVLEWLGIPPRHRTTHESMLDTDDRPDRELGGVVLLDLPDHDSTEVSHQLEVDRLVELADLLVWVLDPQKYADAAIHGRYLAPLRTHAGIMVVVLNHVDTVAEGGRQAMVDDVRRLLDLDGLQDAPVFPVSARYGLGVDDLRAEIADRAEAKQLARERIEADLRVTAERLSQACGDTAPRELSQQRVTELEEALADSAGIPSVVHAVERSTRDLVRRATAWPPVSWVPRGRTAPHRESSTVLPETVSVPRARVATEVRALADDASSGLGEAWASAVRQASVARASEVGDRLEQALAGVDLGSSRLPAWAGVVRGVQWLLALGALAGVVWTGLLLAGGSLGETSQVAGVPVPPVLLVGGVVLGVLLALLCRGRAAGAARTRAATVRRRLHAAVHEVADELVVQPVGAELTAYAAVRAGLDRARR